ncbi:hypothetical protein BV22DRAFT_1067761 [Leucogyrophana mollusca]|uniref:Uncharacterized protein n=1 Tax=Leucogyrophana mollusca TaxID=85980 RepID=A0ACB8BER1_9AGAM|nr:hypothetical protein BV22DRAFT_1067761 [Leucogyrophana mollusca]
MSKHRLSPAPLPPAKRIHHASLFLEQRIVTSFDNGLYDELILFIFSFLDARDLCAVEAANRNCARLASDNQLWKALYIREYGKARLRGGRGFSGRADGKEVKSLPSRALAKGTEALDWKWMYRISSNWRNGRCAIDNLDGNIDRPSDSENIPQPANGTHVLLAGGLIITASSRPSPLPTLSVRRGVAPIHTLICKPSPPHATASISALALDQSPPPLATQDHNPRLAVFLSTGEFSVFGLRCSPSLSSSPRWTYIPRSSIPRTRASPVTHAAYHHPLLVTLSHSFTIMIYDLSDNTVTHTQTLSSFTSYPPTSLVLSAMQTPATYKLVLAYAVPVYPAHWSVGATELIISRSNPSGLSHPFDSTSNLPLGPFMVVKTRTARAVDTPQGFIDERKLLLMRAQWDRKVKEIADTQTDGKWVVLAAGDSPPASVLDVSPPMSPHSPSAPPFVSSSNHSCAHLQLYRLQMPSSAHAPKLTFVRTLHGPLGSIAALSLADGRCVGLSANGAIWVWDLEGGEGVEVAEPMRGDDGEVGMIDGKGTVAFDERRIISAGVRGVQVRRFDV